MDKIFKSFSACNAKVKKLVKPLILAFFNIENKADKDFDVFAAMLNKLNTIGSFENNSVPRLETLLVEEIDMELDIHIR